MAKRHKLADLVKQETEKSEPELTDLQSSEVPDLQSPEVTESPSSEMTDSQTDSPTASQPPAVADLQSSEVPKYLALIRKETRLREDQIDRLTAIARKLNRAKRGGERITENTLIRVAVDLLLDRAESLSGTDEAELLKSLGLKETD